jgi:hypothetical protein
MRLTLEIDTDNSAFGDTDTETAHEAACILRTYAVHLINGGAFNKTLYDTNGSAVGAAWSVSPKPEKTR